jgi:hypothetical protein
VTTAPAPLTARSPMRTPGRMSAAVAPRRPSPISTGAVFARAALHCILRMQRREDLHAGTEEGVVADDQVADVENDAVEVEWRRSRAATSSGSNGSYSSPASIFSRSARMITKKASPGGLAFVWIR